MCCYRRVLVEGDAGRNREPRSARLARYAPGGTGRGKPPHPDRLCPDDSCLQPNSPVEFCQDLVYMSFEGREPGRDTGVPGRPEETLAKVKKPSGKSRTQPKAEKRVPLVETPRERSVTTSLLHLVIYNAAFAAFCLLQVLVVKALYKEEMGLWFFFFYSIVPAFILVSVFVFFHDLLYRDEEDELQ